MISTSLYLAAVLFAASPVRSDETVILFPTAARFDAAQDAWVGEIHGWIYEPEEDSNWRGDLVEAIEEAAELDEIEEDRELFRARVMLFLADNERGKQLDVRIADRIVHCEKSTPNGHFFGAFTVPRAAVVEGITRLPIEIALSEGDERSFQSYVYLVPSEGVSVISDIDDTIKVSNVTNKVELLRNTFARPFTAVPGMPECYQMLADRGATFHYVSASPWQLFAPLETFRADGKFPPGTYDMKTFRLWDDSWRNLTADSGQIKTPAIEKLLKDYPQRKFLLIGDSGEKDPEIYAAIARQFPEQILGIGIRSVREEETLSDERFQQAFKELPPERLLLFKEAEELSAQVKLWSPPVDMP